jgi:transposase-like protein
MDKEESDRMQCPRCQGHQVVKNGVIHIGKPKWTCTACGRQFVASPAQERISEETKALVDNLLLEHISFVGIVRTAGVSARWLQYSVKRNTRTSPAR